MKPADEREEFLLCEAPLWAKGPKHEALLDQACAGNEAPVSRDLGLSILSLNSRLSILDR